MGSGKVSTFSTVQVPREIHICLRDLSREQGVLVRTLVARFLGAGLKREAARKRKSEPPRPVQVAINLRARRWAWGRMLVHEMEKGVARSVNGSLYDTALKWKKEFAAAVASLYEDEKTVLVDDGNGHIIYGPRPGSDLFISQALFLWLRMKRNGGDLKDQRENEHLDPTLVLAREWLEKGYTYADLGMAWHQVGLAPRRRKR